jgi:hypothetical protein
MAVPDNTATWFILHEDLRYGPFTAEQLREGALDHELHPRYDMAWQEGMDDWIPVGEVEGLFEKTGGSEAEQKQDQKNKKNEEKAAPFGENDTDDDSDDIEEEEWSGSSRGGYIFFIYIFPILWFAGLAYGSKLLPEILGENLIPWVVGGLALLPIFTSIIAILQRLDNLAMGRKWFLGLFVPLVNIWLGYRLFACPPGYAEHKKLGWIGWILAIFYWLPIVAIMAVCGLLVVKGPDLYKGILEKNSAQYEKIMQQVKEMTETPEQKKAREEEQKAKEKAAKGPSIIPIRR